MTITHGPLGIRLANGTRIIHGEGGNIRHPLSDAPVVMHELYIGATPEENLSFKGQFGFIEFNTECRLPRHVHISMDENIHDRVLLPERILVLNGIGLTELGGDVFLVGPGSLVDIPPGLPHTWNACPPGIVLPDGTVSTGHFTMVYNYSEKTRFFAIEQTDLLFDASEYVEFKGDVERIRFPELTTDEVLKSATYVWNSDIRDDLGRAN